MKTFTKPILSFMLWMATATFITMNAVNTEIAVEQVSSSVDITEDVDYVITGSTPFTTSGSVNIVNKDHAVVRISKIKPSRVISSWLSHIYIGGEAAQNNVNCQVKMYNNGAIIFPYDKNFRPLTCYTEKSFKGDECNTYSEGNSGGFMKTLNDATLNNKIRSFKLKRGYMVTFAIGTAGWGYSRCFIADKSDLEIAVLPAVLDQKISSYRLFKWQNYGKAGLANDTRYSSCDVLNVTGCYSFGNGENRYPDTECIPHHIYEDWPTAASCGGQTYSCHMKTNNEPGNSADDHPQDVETVLNNWENLMRTGMRLCSESSHDGSMGHLKEFIDSIDARGWRCDILDLHCYWSGGFDSENMNNYSKNYGKGRPIWISEWIWGASWNRNGCFSDGRTEQEIISNTTSILNSLNSNPKVERYFYWNSESKGHIVEGGSLTNLGKVYAAMDTGLGYDSSNEYVPKTPPYNKMGELTYKYTSTKGIISLNWSDMNGDLMNAIYVQCKVPGSVVWKNIATITPKDKSSANGAIYAYTDSVSEPGVYSYRVRGVWLDATTSYYSNEISVNVAPAQGTNSFQHGRLSISDDAEQTVTFSEPFGETPKVFIGTLTNKNSTYQASNFLKSITVKNFTYNPQQWKKNTAKISKIEEVPFMALGEGNYTFKGHNGADLQCEVGEVKSEKALEGTESEVTEVTFKTPFPEDVIPVVLTEVRAPIYKTTGFGVRVFDVTNTGFKFIVYTEESTGVKPTAKNIEYFAITPGVGAIDHENGIYIAAGMGKDSQIFGSSQQINYFYVQGSDDEGNTTNEPLYLYKPSVLTQLQTNNYPSLCMLRRTDITERDESNVTWTKGTSVNRIFDHAIKVDGNTIPIGTTLTDYKDNLGWVCISGKILIGESKQEINIEEEVVAKKGDVNEDGSVDISDIVAVINQIAGTASYPNSDVNKDGNVDISDIVAIINIIANGDGDNQPDDNNQQEGDDNQQEGDEGNIPGNGEEAIEVLSKAIK
jgi:hypothetical protein